MSKLNQEELLEELKEVFDHYLDDLRDYPSEITVKQAYEQIKEMIQKPEVTEEWIEEKVTWLVEEGCIQHLKLSFIKDFIRSLVEEIHGRKIRRKK